MKLFVAGLSKSGKTSRAQYAANRLPNIHYVSVSQMLRTFGGILPVQTLADGLINQRRAADDLSALATGLPHQLIDGHALIETGEGPLIVPDWFFSELAPDLMIYVYDRPHEISLRRDEGTSGQNIAEIAELITMEHAACSRIAKRLAIPLISLEAPSLEEFADQLRTYLE